MNTDDFPAIHTKGGELDVKSETKILDGLAMSGQDIAFSEEMQSLSPEEQEAVTLEHAIEQEQIQNGYELEGQNTVAAMLDSARTEADIDRALDTGLTLDSDSDDGRGSADYRGYGEART